LADTSRTQVDKKRFKKNYRANEWEELELMRYINHEKYFVENSHAQIDVIYTRATEQRISVFLTSLPTTTPKEFGNNKNRNRRFFTGEAKT
jgi:hypothetical protein